MEKIKAFGATFQWRITFALIVLDCLWMLVIHHQMGDWSIILIKSLGYLFLTGELYLMKIAKNAIIDGDNSIFLIFLSLLGMGFSFSYFRTVCDLLKINTEDIYNFTHYFEIFFIGIVFLSSLILFVRTIYYYFKKERS